MIDWAWPIRGILRRLTARSLGSIERPSTIPERQEKISRRVHRIKPSKAIWRVYHSKLLPLRAIQEAIFPQRYSSKVCQVLEPVFVSIDFEFGLNSSGIHASELGVAILDTKSYNDSSQIAASMRFAHYNLVADAGTFAFGKATTLEPMAAGILLDRVCLDPAAALDGTSPSQPMLDKQRNIVLVGHGMGGDIMKAVELGASFPNVVAAFDTSMVYKAKTIAVSLRALLSTLGFSTLGFGRFDSLLHNAGNDAAFTLLAMVVLAEEITTSPVAFYQSARRWNPGKPSVKPKVPARHKDDIQKVVKTRTKARSASALQNAHEWLCDTDVSKGLVGHKKRTKATIEPRNEVVHLRKQSIVRRSLRRAALGENQAMQPLQLAMKAAPNYHHGGRLGEVRGML